MIQHRSYSVNFIYVVVGHIESASYAKCTKSAVT